MVCSAQFFTFRAGRALLLFLFGQCVAPALSSAACSSDAECSAHGRHPASEGSALLQASFASTHITGKDISKEDLIRAVLKSIENASHNASAIQRPEPGSPEAKSRARETFERAADEAENAPTWLFNCGLFALFASGILFLVIAVLGLIELIVRAVRGQSEAHLKELDQKEAKPAPEVKKEAEEEDKKTNIRRGKTVEDVSKELEGFSLWKRLNGDHVRLGILLDLATAKDGDARIDALVEKATKAFKLKLSREAASQAAAGLKALTKAVKRAKKVDMSRLKGKAKFQEAGKQVLAMVRVSKAFNELLGDKSKSTSSWAGDTEGAERLENKYNDGEKNARQFQDTRLGKSPMQAYFASNKWLEHVSILFVFAYSQVCALVYAMYLKTRFPKMYAFMGPWLLISRGEAMAVIVLTMLMVILLTRGLITKVRPYMHWSSVLQTIADKHVLIHKNIGGMLVICAILHVIGHGMGSIPAIIGETSAAKINAAFTYGTKIRFNINSWGEAAVCWPAVTGYMLLLILICFWSLSNEKARRYWFELFHYPHLLLLCFWCGTLIAHGWKQWLGIGVPIASVSVLPATLYYLIERYVAIRHGSREGIMISHAIVKKATLLLEIDTGSSGYAYETGMYAMIKCPEISNFQWHPFTIASGGGHSKFRLLIATVGDWTNRLKDLILEAQKVDGPYPAICVRGGYGAPAQGMRDQKDIIMVGAGVGCTPFLSFLSTICDSKEDGSGNDPYKDLESAAFYWLSREPEDFVWINQYSNIIDTSDHLKDRVAIRLCMTKSLDSSSEDINAAETSLFWLGLEVALTKLDSPQLSQELGVPTQFGRPKWEKEFATVVKDLTKKRGKTPSEIAVFVCGNKMLVNALEEACTAATGPETKFRLYAEEF